jgi:hypothetical protein
VTVSKSGTCTLASGHLPETIPRARYRTKLAAGWRRRIAGALSRKARAQRSGYAGQRTSTSRRTCVGRACSASVHKLLSTAALRSVSSDHAFPFDPRKVCPLSAALSCAIMSRAMFSLCPMSVETKETVSYLCSSVFICVPIFFSCAQGKSKPREFARR